MKLVTEKKFVKVKEGILIEGLPGIGNVGKIALDYLVETLKAKKVAEIVSDKFPSLVIINEDNMVDMLTLSIFHKKISTQDFFFLVGDFQPGTEETSYELTKLLIDFSLKNNINKIITLGGIGLEMTPDNPSVYTTGNDIELIKTLKKSGANSKIYGKVGTIIGITGLLLGMTKIEKISAATLLAETSYEPGILAVESAKKLLKVLSNTFKLKVSTKKLDEESFSEKKMHSEEVDKLKKLPKFEETNYIG